jgi:hypothetical protein
MLDHVKAQHLGGLQSEDSSVLSLANLTTEGYVACIRFDIGHLKRLFEIVK